MVIRDKPFLTVADVQPKMSLGQRGAQTPPRDPVLSENIMQLFREKPGGIAKFRIVGSGSKRPQF